jgi:tetrahydromethanopterin S-methyltransferase subunit G
MDDKTFELLTKMYSEFSAKFDKVDSRLDKIDSRLDKVDSRLDKVEITLENDIKTNIQILHEREAINSEKLDEHSKQLTNINKKLDYLTLSVKSQDKRLEVIESSKKKRVK